MSAILTTNRARYVLEEWNETLKVFAKLLHIGVLERHGPWRTPNQATSPVPPNCLLRCQTSA
eukprot:4394231-Amphidinium_carterae.1